MDTFLRQTAQRILDEHPDDTGRVLVVFNNHRSELFMRRAFETISAEKGSAFFLPEMTVIDDLVASLGGLKTVPNEFLLFELFRLHVDIGGEERKYKNFEDFIAFGDLMISDFSEIDRYCVDARSLFLNLRDLKAIDSWDVENPTLSPFEQQYIEFYHSLFKYYTGLRAALEARGEAYSGMAYRHVAENIATLADSERHVHLYFVGFNALSECERRIIGEYTRRGKATLITDADTYYYADPMQEAGLFLRRHSDEFPSIVPHGQSLFATGEKSITIVECPESALQCKYAGKLLAEHSDWLHDPESTAVVLANEKLLIPMLNSLPDSDEDYGVNISMGFAYSDSGIHALMEKLLALYQRANQQGYYHADVIEVLSDHHIGCITGIAKMRQKATDSFLKDGRIRCTASDVATLVGSDSLGFMFPPVPPTPPEALAIMRETAALLASADTTGHNRKEHQALGGLAEILDFFGQMTDFSQYVTDISTLGKIYSRIARRHIIAFLGKPLSGLQMLGMLETRNLDFKRIILLSANEGVLPLGRSQNTLIPYMLQRAFGLPTFDEKDAVYAYNFYRLLQRASEVYLVYSSETERTGKGEESRFIKQVRQELCLRFPQHIKVQEAIVDTDSTLSGTDIDLTGRRTPGTEARLHDIAIRGFSPSSLKDYVMCPLNYYYSRLLNVRPPDSLDDDLDASHLGTCIHMILEQIYAPSIGRPLTVGLLQQALADLPTLADSVFSKHLSNGRPREGRNSFMRSVAESQLKHMLKKEMDIISEGNRIEVIAVEQEIKLPIEGLDMTACLKGTVDRIDRINGQLRIIDYKTGSLNPKEINVSSEQVEEFRLPAKWLQLMCYALLYCRKANLGETVHAGIYPLRDLKSGVQLARWDKTEDITAERLATFESVLSATIGNLLDPERPFEATPGSDSCRHCPIKTFCPSAK